MNKIDKCGTCGQKIVLHCRCRTCRVPTLPVWPLPGFCQIHTVNIFGQSRAKNMYHYRREGTLMSSLITLTCALQYEAGTRMTALYRQNGELYVYCISGFIYIVLYIAQKHSTVQYIISQYCWEELECRIQKSTQLMAKMGYLPFYNGTYSLVPTTAPNPTHPITYIYLTVLEKIHFSSSIW